MKRNCAKPLPDGSECMACRIYDAVFACERAIEPDKVEAGYVNVMRCLEGLSESMVHFLAQVEPATMAFVLRHILVEAMDMREQGGPEEQVGHA